MNNEHHLLAAPLHQLDTSSSLSLAPPHPRVRLMSPLPAGRSRPPPLLSPDFLRPTEKIERERENIIICQR